MTPPHKKRRSKAGDAVERALAEGRALTAAEGKKLFAPKPPSESVEQAHLVKRVRAALAVYPALANFFAVPNQTGGDEASIRRAHRMLAEGMSPGYPDTGLDVARGGYYGLRIEMKREAYFGTKQGEPSEEQSAWHKRLAREGYAMFICWGTEPAWVVLRWYLDLLPTREWKSPPELAFCDAPAKQWRQILL
jgi:hypothetical protein